MTRKSKVRYNRFRTYRLNVSPTTRAIRSAILGLAVASAAVAPAYAGTCTFSAPATYDCEGVFNNTISYVVDDLTVYVGTTLFAVITPASGTDGIYLSDNVGGYVDLTTDAASVILDSYATGIHVNAETVDIDSSGSIVSYYGDGILAQSVYDTTVVSGGSINVLDAGNVGSGYDLTGVAAYASLGDVNVTQAITGSITAVTTYGPGAASTGIGANAYFNASVDVNGAISAITQEGTATGVHDVAFVGNATVDVSQYGDISAVVGDIAGYDAYGVLASSAFGSAGITNDGAVSARTYGYGQVAYGLSAVGHYNASIDNTGTVHADALGIDGYAVGVQAHSTYFGTANVQNTGDIYALADSSTLVGPADSTAFGAIATGFYAFVNNNGGNISAGAYAYNGNATATGIYVSGFDGGVYNFGGAISADASTVNGDATATGAHSSGFQSRYTGDATATLTANAATTYGDATATGIDVDGQYSQSTTNGAVDVSARVYGDGFYTAQATGIDVNGSSVANALNYGDVNAYAYGGGFDNTVNATGISSVSTGNYFASSAFVMNGYGGYVDVRAIAPYGNATATGTSSTSYTDAFNYNRESISAYASTGDFYNATAVGMATRSQTGDARSGNFGDLYATAMAGDYAYATAIGMYTEGAASAYSRVTGHLESYAYSGYYGHSYAYGTITISAGYARNYNIGNSIIATASAGDHGTAIAVASNVLALGAADTQNNGLIAAYADAGDYGYALATASETTSVADIATFNGSQYSSTYAIATTGYQGDSIANGVQVTGLDGAYANSDGSVDARAYTGNGSVGFYATASANGVVLSASGGNATLNVGDYGDVYAVARGGDYSVDISYATLVSATGDASTVNDGYIHAVATAGYFYSSAVAVGNLTYSQNGYASISGSGDINAYAASGYHGYSFAVGAVVEGDLGASATINGNDTAQARSGDYGTSIAYGVYVLANGNADADILGRVQSVAVSGDYGHSIAVGTAVSSSTADASMEVDGGYSRAVAFTGDYAYAYAHGAQVNSATGSASVSVDNFGIVTGSAYSGYHGFSQAYGVAVQGQVDATVDAKYGGIGASAESGDYGVSFAEAINANAATGDASVSIGALVAYAQAGSYAYAGAHGANVQGANYADASVYGYARVIAQVYDYATAVATGFNVDATTLDASFYSAGALVTVEALSGYHGQSFATGVNVDAGRDASADNQGTVYAVAVSGGYGFSSADGIDVYGANTGSLTNNDGAVIVIAQAGYRGYAYAYGVDVSANAGQAYLSSYGAIAATAVSGDYGRSFSQAATVYSANGNADAYLGGFVNASSSAGYQGLSLATGIEMDSPNGSAYLYDESTMDVSATTGDYGTALAEGATVVGFDYASSVHYGDTTVYALAGDHAAAIAVGFYVGSPGGSAYLYNTGSITGHAVAGDYSLASATGSYVHSVGYDAYTRNTGEIHAYAQAGYDGNAYATGSMTSSGQGTAELYNTGYSIVATAYTGDFGLAVAQAAVDTGAAGASTYNYGLISATAGAGSFAVAHAYGSQTTSSAGDAYLYNDGNIVATAFAAYYSTAVAHGAIVNGQVDATAYNYGNIGAYATVNDGTTSVASATGIMVVSQTNIAYLYNDGSIYGSAISDYQGTSTAYGAIVTGPNGASLQGNGTVDAYAFSGYGGYSRAVGAVVTSGAGYVDVAMNGFAVDAVAGDYGTAIAIGVNASAVGDSEVSIYGDSHANATSGKYGTSIAEGVIVYSSGGYAHLDNYGEMDVNALTGNYLGGTATAIGAQVTGFLGASAYSPGAIYATANAKYHGTSTAEGILLSSATGDAYLYNGTAIHADAGGFYVDTATAIGASVYGYVDATVQGAGNFEASANSKYNSTAHAVDVTANSGDAYLYSGSYINASAHTSDYNSGLAIAHGATVYGYNYADVYIQGTVNATASGYNSTTAQAFGVTVTAHNDDAYLYVGGDVHASAYTRGYGSVSQAIGAIVNGYGYADATIEGSVSAFASTGSNATTAQAIGVIVTATNDDAYLYDGGDITASAFGGYTSTAQAIGAIVTGSDDAGAHVYYSIGALASTYSGFSQAIGINVTAQNNDAYLYVGGDVSARAYSGYGSTAQAQGANVIGYNYADAYVYGNISALAVVSGPGSAQARGIEVIAQNFDAYLYAGGAVSATALDFGNNASATAQGAYVLGNDYAGAYVYGTVSAYALAGYASTVTARGIDVLALNNNAYLNAGAVYATALASYGSTAIAQGAYVRGFNYADAYIYGTVGAVASAGNNSTAIARGIDVIGQNADAYLYVGYNVDATATAGDASTAQARGAYVLGFNYASATVEGSIDAYASVNYGSATAHGIDIVAQNADAALNAYGNIYATAISGSYSFAQAQGATVNGFGNADAYVSGVIEAYASVTDHSIAQAGGINVTAQTGDAYLYVGGHIYATALATDHSIAQAHGAYVTGYDYATAYVGDVIDAYASATDYSIAQAVGIRVTATNNDAYLYNNYGVYATALVGDNSIAQATGATVNAPGYATAIVYGPIEAYAHAGDYSIAQSLGIQVNSSGSDAYLFINSYMGTSAIAGDGGSIASAQSAAVYGYDYATAITNGIGAYAYTGFNGISRATGITVDAHNDDAFLYDGGVLNATAISGYNGASYALGGSVNTDYGKYATAIVNGQVNAYAYSGYSGVSIATGITVNTDGGFGISYLYAGSGIYAGAISDDFGYSRAVGGSVTADWAATAISAGDITAHAYAGDQSVALATGLNVSAKYAYAGITGNATAVASALFASYSRADAINVTGDKYAGAVVYGDVGAYASNYSGVALASGVDVVSNGNAYGGGNAYLYVSGNINASATSGASSIAVAQGASVFGEYSATAIVNYVNAYAYTYDQGTSVAGGIDVTAHYSDAFLLSYGNVGAEAISKYNGVSLAHAANVVSDLGDATSIIEGLVGAAAYSGDSGISVASGVSVTASAGNAYSYSIVAESYAISKYAGYSQAHSIAVDGFVDASAIDTQGLRAQAYSGDQGTSIAIGATVYAHTGEGYLYTGGSFDIGAYSGYSSTAYALAGDVYALGYAHAVNTADGDVNAEAGDSSTAAAHGFDVVSGNNDAYMYNSGSFDVVADVGDTSAAFASGITVVSNNYDATVISPGTVYADASAGANSIAQAYGVRAFAVNGDAYVYANNVYAFADVYNGIAIATAIDVEGLTYAGDYNVGLVQAGAYAGDASIALASAFIVHASTGYAYLYNGGEGYAVAVAGDNGSIADAIGSSVVGPLGATTINLGHLEAEAFVGDYGTAYALGNETRSSAGSAYVFNAGYSMIALAYAGDHSTATANASVTYGFVDSTTINTGLIFAYAYSGDYSDSNALGNSTVAGTGYAYLYSSGPIYAGAISGYDGDSAAVGAFVQGPAGATTISYNDIVAYAYSGDEGTASALGSTTTSANGIAYLYSGGYISATAISGYNGDAYARGAAVLAPNGAYGVSNGDINAYASVGDYGTAEAHGAMAVASAGYASFHAHGDVSSTAISGYYGISQAYGVEVRGYDGAYTHLSGYIATYAYSGDQGVSLAYGSITDSDSGYSFLHSDYIVSTYAVSGYSSAAEAFGGIVTGYDGADALNHGNFYTGAFAGDGSVALAMGVLVSTTNGYASLYSSGYIYTTAQDGDYSVAEAFGTQVTGPAGAGTTNFGDITTVAIAGYGSTALAFGSITQSTLGEAYSYNYGNMYAYAAAGTVAEAFGNIVSAYLDANTYSSGSIIAHAYAYDGTAQAYGSLTTSSTDDAYTYNSGTIGAWAAGYYGSRSIGVGTFANDFAGTYNEGDIYALSYAFDGDANATGAMTTGYVAFTGNYGSVTAGAYTVFGDASATGVLTDGTPYAGLYGGGDIYATAITYIGRASAVGAVTMSDSVAYAGVGGTVQAYAYTYDGTALATGVYTVAPDNAYTNISGDVSATAISVNTGPSLAYGTYTTGYYATTTNTGSISAYAMSDGYYAHATGIYNSGAYSYVYNNGSTGSYAYSDYGVAIATGIDSEGTYVSYVYSNDVTAIAEAFDGQAAATGIHSEAQNYDSTVITVGDVYASASADFGAAFAYGTVNLAGTFGEALTDNSGNVTALASAYDGTAVALGMLNSANYFGAYTYNSGSVSASAYADYGQAFAYGVINTSNYGNAYFSNYGSVVASATAYDGIAVAHGSDNTGKYYANTYNSGNITAYADAGDSADGVAVAMGSNTSSSDADGHLYNDDGAITAWANGGDYAGAFGATVYGYNFAYAYNSGSISASAYANALARAVGLSVESYNNEAGAYNYGSISAYATADVAIAVGAQSSSDQANAYLGNWSTIDADAAGSDYALAIGSDVYGGSIWGITYNVGSISATATADDTAVAIGSRTGSEYGDAGLYNYGGTISATATGYNAFAEGASVNAYDYAYVENIEGSSIDGTANGYYATAIGVDAYSSNGDVTVQNFGDITAHAYGENAAAIAVRVTGYYDGYVYNSDTGTIAAYGDGMRRAIQGGDYIEVAVVNYGDIIGSIGTGNYNDSLFNGDGGYWLALQSSDFGDGDDLIVNDVGGVIVMPGSAIYMGGYSADGNAFYNYGLIVVLGDALIDMGGNYTLAPGANPLPFYSSGVIDMLDGDTNDSLTINGSFQGSGDLDVDVSLTPQDADRLYITGDIVEPTETAINIALTGHPTQATTFIPIVDVDGASQEGDFVLGNISGVPTNLFYTMDLDIVRHEGSPDQFGLGIDLTGLNPRGLLASSIGPALQNAWHSITGTVFQREGTDREGRIQGFELGARVFRNNGKMEPGLGDRNFGPGGDRRVDADTSGGEVSFQYNFNEAWSVGALLGTQKLDIKSAGGGKADGDGNLWGLFASYAPSDTGFYGDLSYREMDFDLDAKVLGGDFKETGKVSGWSLEMGYAFQTAGGLKIEPQFQYSKLNVDGLDPIASGWGDFTFDNNDSTRVRAGVAIRKTFKNDEDHEWTPYLSINAVHEMDGSNDFGIDNDTFTGQADMSGTSTLVEAGATGRIRNWTLFGGLNWMQGGGYRSTLGGQLGVRYSFGGAAPAPAPVVAPPAKTCADLDDDGDGVNNCDDKCLGSTAGQAVGPDGCPVPLTIDLKGVNFDFDKATLRPDAIAILDEAVSILQKYPDLKVEVAGHTDSIGTEQYNQGLSERRAQAVYDYLGQHGIGGDRLVGPNGYGETRPIAPNTNEDGSDNPEGRAKNRRTELNTQN